MLKLQRGSSSSYMSFILGVILCCIILKITTALMPAYFDDRMIDDQIKQAVLASKADTQPANFIANMEQRLSMNNVRDVKFADIAKVQQTGSGIVVYKKYEVRKNFVLNVDLAMTFEKKIDKSNANE